MRGNASFEASLCEAPQDEAFFFQLHTSLILRCFAEQSLEGRTEIQLLDWIIWRTRG